MFGYDGASTAKIEQLAHEILDYIDKPIAQVVQPIFRNKVEEQREAMGKAAEQSKNELNNIERRLTSSKWLAGPDFSAADIIFIPTYQRLLRALNKMPELAGTLGLGDIAAQYPQLNHWNQQVETLPAFQSSFPPHWRNPA